ncbi:MAG: hypothetical protein JWN14_3631 [Chthonomonadales bacterium]|nr:hypothetical protein [Chthonomonadales bacterium]
MRKRLWGCGIGGMSVAGIAVTLWFLSIDRLNLVDRSTRITSVHGWGMERPDLNLPARFYDFMGGGAQYQWVGDRQVLFFHGLVPIQAINTGSPTRPHYSLSWPDSVGTPTLYDVATHREIPMPNLAEFFRHTQGKAENATVSPDGSRMLWNANDAHFYSALLDGTQHAQMVNDGHFEMGWPPDRKRFYTYTSSEDDHKNGVIALHLWDAQTGDYLTERQFAQPKNYELMGDCALLPDGGLATNNMQFNHPALLLYHISAPPHSMVRTVTPKLPSDAQVEALVYSPQGDRLAWIMTRSRPSSLSFLHRLLPHFNPLPIRTTSLWVSGAMGENLHEIGHIPVRSGGRQFYLIDYVRWQPDEKTLSFVSKDVLYTVPAH